MITICKNRHDRRIHHKQDCRQSKDLLQERSDQGPEVPQGNAAQTARRTQKMGAGTAGSPMERPPQKRRRSIHDRNRSHIRRNRRCPQASWEMGTQAPGMLAADRHAVQVVYCPRTPWQHPDRCALELSGTVAAQSFGRRNSRRMHGRTQTVSIRTDGFEHPGETHFGLLFGRVYSPGAR